MEVFECIYTRRSTRRFKKGEKIPDWKLERILDTARWGPSPDAMQNYRFIIVRNEETKKFLADLSQELASVVFGSYPYELVAGRQWFVPEHSRPGIFEYMADGSLFRYPEDADVVLVGLETIADIDYLLPFPPADKFATATIGMVMENISLAAQALGVGCVYNGMPVTDLRNHNRVCEHLGIPRTHYITGLLCLGVPAVAREAGPSRFPIESMVYDEYWGNEYIRKDFCGE